MKPGESDGDDHTDEPDTHENGGPLRVVQSEIVYVPPALEALTLFLLGKR